jgi:hypothetical protein
VAKCGVSALVKEAMVMRDDGNQVDVHRDFNVLSAPADHEGSPDGQDAPSDGGD